MIKKLQKDWCDMVNENTTEKKIINPTLHDINIDRTKTEVIDGSCLEMMSPKHKFSFGLFKYQKNCYFLYRITLRCL